MDKVRMGIIGIGNMGRGHAKTLDENKLEDIILTAVCDTDADKLDWAKENLHDVKCFSTAEEMLESGLIDAVIISVPHYDHPPLAIKAFKHGINVMCEKPAGVYTKQAREMMAAAEKSGLVFGMMFNQRTNCVYRKMHELVKSGEIGAIKRTNWIITDWYRPQAYYDSGGWRATWSGEGGGVLLNQCPHNLDLWQWICGMPNKVTAFCHEGKWRDIEVEDDVTAYVEYPNGATGVFITTTGDACGTNRFEINGDKGKLICEKNKLTLHKLEMPESEFNKINKVSFPKLKSTVEEVELDGLNPQHSGVLAAFAANILRNEPLVAEGHEGINGLILSNAMHLSSWLNKTIELPLDEELFLSELNKRRENSRRKENVTSTVTDLNGTY